MSICLAGHTVGKMAKMCLFGRSIAETYLRGRESLELSVFSHSLFII